MFLWSTHNSGVMSLIPRFFKFVTRVKNLAAISRRIPQLGQQLSCLFGIDVIFVFGFK
jgi:hypothetical protein